MCFVPGVLHAPCAGIHDASNREQLPTGIATTRHPRTLEAVRQP